MKRFFAIAGTLLFFFGFVAPKVVVLTVVAALVAALCAISWYLVFNDEK